MIEGQKGHFGEQIHVFKWEKRLNTPNVMENKKPTFQWSLLQRRCLESYICEVRCLVSYICNFLAKHNSIYIN
jgi:hypothetical protein